MSRYSKDREPGDLFYADVPVDAGKLSRAMIAAEPCGPGQVWRCTAGRIGDEYEIEPISLDDPAIVRKVPEVILSDLREKRATGILAMLYVVNGFYTVFAPQELCCVLRAEPPTPPPTRGRGWFIVKAPRLNVRFEPYNPSAEELDVLQEEESRS